MQKQQFSIIFKALFALNLLFFAACRNEIGVSDVDSKCVVGPTVTGSVIEVGDNAGRYSTAWTTVPNATGYQVVVLNESSGTQISSNTQVNNTVAPIIPYTCDSILVRVTPILGSGTLCLPQGQTKQLSRPRGGITAIILERTTGSCNQGNRPTLKYFNDTSFQIGSMPIYSSFSNGVQNLQALQTTFNNKILGNVDSAGYLKIVRKNCTTGAVINTHTEFVTRAQTNGNLTELSSAIVGAAGRAGVLNPFTNTSVFLDSIRFEK